MADMEEMIKEEISRIGGLKERVVFKDVIERLFLSLYETNQEMYRELESRIMDDLVFDLNRYQITMGIMEREYLDPSHHLLSPMRETDMTVPAYDIPEMTRQLGEEGGAWSERILWNMTIWGYKSFWTRSGSGEGSIRMWVTIRQSLP